MQSGNEVGGIGLSGQVPVDNEDLERRVRVRDVVTIEPMRASKVLAGSGGLDREVTGLNIVEVPDVCRWLKGGEFLFSAEYALRDMPERLGRRTVNRPIVWSGEIR